MAKKNCNNDCKISAYSEGYHNALLGLPRWKQCDYVKMRGGGLKGRLAYRAYLDGYNSGQRRLGRLL